MPCHGFMERYVTFLVQMLLPRSGYDSEMAYMKMIVKFVLLQITREEAENLLKANSAPDGQFLVRESTNFPGDYTLCVCYQKKVEHYRVIAKV